MIEALLSAKANPNTQNQVGLLYSDCSCCW